LAVYLLGGWCSPGGRFRHRLQLPASDRLTFFAVLTALLGVMVHASMDFPLQMPSIELYAVVSARHPVELPELDWQIRCAQRLERGMEAVSIDSVSLQGKPYRASNDEFLNIMTKEILMPNAQWASASPRLIQEGSETS